MTSSLRDLVAANRHGERHASTYTNRSGLAAAEHAAVGAAELRRLAPIVLESVVPALDLLLGRWHPAGYMVYSLGTHADLGSLRLHIWPAELRRAEERPPGVRDVHDHVLHISSLVLAGTYVDELYQVWAEDQNLEQAAMDKHGLFRVYTPSAGESGSALLNATAEIVGARVIGERVIDSGDSHAIAAGLYHAPRIPPSDLCVTLSFSSYPVMTGGPHILIQGRPRQYRGTLRTVASHEAKHASEQAERFACQSAHTVVR